jgi:hypothetical protein
MAFAQELKAQGRASFLPDSVVRGGKVVRRVAGRVLLAASRILERNTWLCLTLIVLSFMPLVLAVARTHDLTCDELYTLGIARQASVAKMIEVSRTLDLHPPLHYFTERAALALPLPRWLGSRLPSILAGQIMLLAVFWLLRREVGNMAGMVGTACLWFSPAMDYPWSNRPYSLWLCFLALTALFWTLSTEDDRKWWQPIALVVSALSMTAVHMFGLACLLPFFVAEALRTYRKKAIDWPVVLAVVLPSLMVISYFRQIKAMGVNTFSPRYLPSMGMAIDLYSDMVTVSMAALIGAVVVAAVLIPRPESHDLPKIFRKEYWAMAISLSLMPLVLMVAATIHPTQFFQRYGVCGAVGVALLAAFFTERFVPRARAIAVLLTVGMVAGSATRLYIETRGFDVRLAFNLTGLPPKSLEELDPKLPIVVAAGTEFTELNDREPMSVARNLYYVTDFAAAAKYSGQTVFDGEQRTIDLLGMPGKTEALKPFLTEHPTFYLISNYTSTEEWLARYLIAQGAHVELCGKFLSKVQTNDLYRVTVSPDMPDLKNEQQNAAAVQRVQAQR